MCSNGKDKMYSISHMDDDGEEYTGTFFRLDDGSGVYVGQVLGTQSSFSGDTADTVQESFINAVNALNEDEDEDEVE